LQVIGFLKSNALESVYSPALIGFAWESGAAAFCSIFKKRRSRELNEGVSLFDNNINRDATVIQEVNEEEEESAKAQDLLVVWTTFCRRPRDGVMTAKVVADGIRELVQLQSYLHDQAGKNGVKIICVATGVPPEWTPSSENLLGNCPDLGKDVAAELNIPFEDPRSWSDRPDDDDNLDDDDSPQTGRESMAQLFRSSMGVVQKNLRGTTSSATPPMSTELLDKQSPLSSEPIKNYRPSFIGAGCQESLVTAAAPTPEETIFRLQNRAESWVSVRDALTR
jgi:hypothetical protein